MAEDKKEVQKTFLEKKLENKANDLFDREWYELKNLLGANKIARQTKFDVVYKTENGEEKRVKLSLYELVDNFRRYGNYGDVYKARMEKLTEEEIDNLLNKLENIRYLFDQA